jgi:hypothetical protein
MIIPRWIVLTVRHISDKALKKITTHILCPKTFVRKSCLIADNVGKYCRGKQAIDDNMIRRVRFACWIIKATDTHSEYVILIAFERQHFLREGTLMLRHTYFACLVRLEKVVREIKVLVVPSSPSSFVQIQKQNSNISLQWQVIYLSRSNSLNK